MLQAICTNDAGAASFFGLACACSSFWKEQVRVNTTTVDVQIGPNIAALSDGGYVVTWTSDGQDGSSYGIYAQRYNASGVAQGAEFRVNTNTTNNQWIPSVAMASLMSRPAAMSPVGLP